jgi:flavin-dependent dehydrogenase
MRVSRRGDECDVFVIGGGPAGATAGRLLAEWGWNVRLVHRAADRPALAESLPPSTRRLLAFLGQLDAVDAAGFHPNDGNVARWAGASRTTPTESAGYHVCRKSFDATLRESARAAGAAIVEGVAQRADCGEPARITVAGPHRRDDVLARLLLDCSGRAGVVARRGFRRNLAAYRTLAIVAEWTSDEWPIAEQTRTIVESYDDGWAWSVPLSRTRRQCTVMIDPAAARAAREGAPGGAAMQQIYATALARTRELRQRVEHARQSSRPWATRASVYDAPTPCEPGVLLVGDAASFIEPLSSAGVKKAMTSGWRAAVVANTCLANPSMTSHALDFYARREREVFSECQAVARKFFCEAAAHHRTPFWTVRDERIGDSDHHEHGEDVRRALDRLRSAGAAKLRPSPALRFETAPDIEGREVVLREAIVVPGWDRPLQFAAGVDLPALVRLAGNCRDVPGIFSSYHAHVGAAPIDCLVTGLSLLLARQALILEDGRP